MNEEISAFLLLGVLLSIIKCSGKLFKENVMKIRTATVVVVLAFLTSTVFAVSHIGPPTAELNKGQWSGGFNYSYSKQDLEKTKVKWAWYDDGVLSDTGTTRVKIKDVKTNLYYFNVGYGIDDWWQLYVQLGVADVKANANTGGDDSYFEGGKFGLNFDNDFAWGWGTKVTFAKQDKIDWGAAFQMNWLNTSVSGKSADSGTDWSESWKDTVDIKTYDLLLAVGPTVDMGGWKLYGGPFFYYLSGDLTAKESGIGTDTGGDYTWSGRAKGDLKADGNFGGYIGAQFELAKNCNATIELSSTGNGWGLGTGITFKF